MNPYTANVISYSDSYPFGMLMPNRHGADVSPSDMYKYGYQGSEKDGEIHGESYTTYFRQLDTRIGRWLSTDPKINHTERPYVSMSNNPINFNDQKGDSIRIGKLSKSHSKAVGELFDNKESYDELAKFAKKGQKVDLAGKTYTFEEDGEFHDKGINMNFIGEGENRRLKGGFAEGTSGHTFVKGKNVYVATREQSTEKFSETLSTITHETMFHGLLFGQDLFDDGIQNFSNVNSKTKKYLDDYYKKNYGYSDDWKIYSKNEYHHFEVDKRYKQYGMKHSPHPTSNPIYIGVSVMKAYYERNGIPYSEESIVKTLKGH